MNDAKTVMQSRVVYMEYDIILIGFAGPVPYLRVKILSFATERITLVNEPPMNFGSCQGLFHSSHSVWIEFATIYVPLLIYIYTTVYSKDKKTTRLTNEIERAEYKG